MSEYIKLQEKIKNFSRDEVYNVIEKLKYKGSYNKAIEKIESLKNNSLREYLQKPHFDFHYSSKEFLYKLAEILNLDVEKLKKEVKEIDDYLTIISKLPEPYIFVDTNFKRANQPIFALAFMEGKRRIGVNKEEVYNKPLDEVLKNVGEFVKNHYKKNEGKLPMWGKIHKYVYHHIDGKSYVFDKEGNLIDDEIAENKATLKIKNKEIKI
ncbi:hypothetical protein FE773_07455 [Caminibacter mediatlanticus TB-2]|uniref:Uncharacterized protein n=1 Tax=Caminibacter mediatlanticus TB-2 TaxID=391592 RepID=A0ABX5VD93_9BACT|nr:hypothetical protein [Caminibacter mediatlanticus]QCT95031.1 hypothetical protein FE773_07455 [Caminibacter mediatlanticus TB-2]